MRTYSSPMTSPSAVVARGTGNWQTSAPSSPLPTTLRRNVSFTSNSSSHGTLASTQSTWTQRKQASTLSRTASSPSKIGMDKEDNAGFDEVNDSFEVDRESRELVFGAGKAYRSSSPECTYVFKTENFWRRFSREKLRSCPGVRRVSSGISGSTSTMRRSGSFSRLVTRPCSALALPEQEACPPSSALSIHLTAATCSSRNSPAAPEDPVISVLGQEFNTCTPPTTERYSNCASVPFDKPPAVNSSHLNAQGDAAAFADMSSALLNFI